MTLKQISTIIIAIVITAFVTYLLVPSKTVTVPHSITQADTGRVANEAVLDAIKDRDAILQENSWLKRQLKLAQVQNPVGGAISNPNPSPITAIPVPDSVTNKAVPLLYPYDFPIGVTVGRSKITFLTMNPYLRYYDKPYVKTYEYSRSTSDFEFALVQTVSTDNLDGIVLKANERFFAFDGISVGTGVMFPQHFYALLEFKFSMYERLQINPRITSFPEIGIELKYDIVR